MDADASSFKRGSTRGHTVRLSSAFDRDSKFVLAKTGRDVWMRLGRYVWIHTKGKARAHSHALGSICQKIKLCLRFYVEDQDISP